MTFAGQSRQPVRFRESGYKRTDCVEKDLPFAS